MMQRKLHPATRRHIIIEIRIYLRWLHEHSIISAEPDDLIRREDLPKLPDYLPRPLDPKVDQELQMRFARSRNIYAKALLLMRKTGIRIGELLALEFDCVRSDSLGNQFLKVPLGKMNNERLVPLDNGALEIIATIKQRCPVPRKYLVSKRKRRKAPAAKVTQLLGILSTKLKLKKRIQSHQLRHTAATELLNAGMTIPALMRFLGHKDYRMTFRYARIAQPTLVSQFKDARSHIEQRYEKLMLSSDSGENDPAALVSSLVAWIKNNAQRSDRRKTRTLEKRLLRIKAEIEKIKRRLKSAT
jgi:site-specific recombinase XerD